uniref:Uncharacterized protein n=1 Tax=Parascaris equorum TaxID=6256 RepID=A0A914RVJ6_PAREQ
MELCKAAKLESRNIKLRSKERQKHRATITEFGDEVENFAVLLQNSGATHGHAVGQWAEPDDDVRDGSTTAAHDEIVIPRRIYMRVSEDTQFRNVPIAYSKAEVTGVNKVTSALFDKPALGTLADSVRGGTENSIWHGDTERGRAQISTSTMSENTSSAGSTTGASFEQLDISQDDRSHLVAVSDLSNACRQD